MRPKRMTRAESRELTRRRLLDAAALSIAEKGLAATSVEDIAAQAGYTRGAFYSNFSSKCDLFVELLRLDHQNVQENLRELLDAKSSCEDFQQQIASLYTRRYRDGGNYVIWAEARLHAMRDAKFRQYMDALCLEKRDMVAQLIEQFRTRLNLKLPALSADQALAAIALMDSIVYFNMTMPDELPNTSAEAILGNLLTRIISSPSA